MEPITIILPDPVMKDFVDQIVASGTYQSASDYIAQLINEDRQRRNQARLEALLLEGLEGELSQLPDQDFDDMRREYDEQFPEVNRP